MARSVVINYLEKLCIDNGISLAYVYFNYEDREKNQSATNMLGSPLRQLLQRKGAAPDNLMALYNNYSRGKERLKLTDIVTLLQSECLSGPKTYIVVDALDECSAYNNTSNTFVDELSKLPPTIHLLLTSRPNVNVVHKINYAIWMEIQASNNDIAKYVEQRVEDNDRLRSYVKGDAEFKATIVSRIVQSAKGLYVPTNNNKDGQC
jgi:hypothetical protein